MYFLEPSEAVKDNIAHPFIYGVSRNLLELLQEKLRHKNQICKKLCEKVTRGG